VAAPFVSYEAQRAALAGGPAESPAMHLSTPALLAWPRLTPEQQAQVRGLAISEAQVEYAGSGARQLAAVEAESGDDLVGLAVLVDGHAVGFLVLKRRSLAPAWAEPDGAVVSGMRIDQRLQGTGIGSSALALLPAWLRQHWPGCPAITLTVDEANLRGRKAYARAGFVDQGEREAGRIGWVRRMRLPIGPAA
jgi:RimJ/RimL family protein N-acetyltransferase